MTPPIFIYGCFFYIWNMVKSGDIVRFNGHLDRRAVDDILMELQEKLEKLDLQIAVRKRVYSASVECLDNIFKHAGWDTVHEKLNNRYPSFFRLSVEDGIYRIEISNVVRDADIGYIEQRLNHLNKLNREELNELFKETLQRGGGLTEKGGAGLGLIVLAKTTSEPMEYNFRSIGRDHSYFTLVIHIS